MTRARLRKVLAVVVPTVLVATPAWMWQQSRVPDTYSVMQMGYPDYGGGPSSAHASHGGRSVTELVVDRTRKADVRVELEARQQRFRLASGEQVDGYTLNGTSPGPTVRVTQGQLLEVRLRNADVRDGVALHWHGIDVPNAEDGVAGVTQDAVAPGGEHTYRFVAEQAGTFWYHSHQVSHVQVRRGLLGAVVVSPRTPLPTRDVLALTHVYGGKATVNGRVGTDTVAARPGEKVRVRVVNTDNGALRPWVSGPPYRLLALDGYDLHEPTPVTDRSVVVGAGGRADLEVTAPAVVHLGAARLMVGEGAPVGRRPRQPLDLLTYGRPAALPFDPDQADRRFRYHIGRRPGFVDGRPGLWWSINSKLFPDVPMYHVSEGDVVRMVIRNRSFEAHPMHLHGHHAVVLSRNGVRSTGSPWWVDSLEVEHGDTYEIAFLADNPGVWMDHCHNLPHAKEGLVAHLVYEGVTTPYRVGGQARNRPE